MDATARVSPGPSTASAPSTAFAPGLPRPGIIGMWTFIGTDVMGFGGLLVAYAVLRTRAVVWPDPADRHEQLLGLALTVLLALSAGTASAMVRSLREGRRRGARLWCAVTVLLGALFLAGQIAEYGSLWRGRQIGLRADHAAGLFYVITGYHGLHVLAGLIALPLVLLGSRRHGHPQAVVRRAEVAVLYWQFVDVVWLVLFPILYLLPTAGHG